MLKEALHLRNQRTLKITGYIISLAVVFLIVLIFVLIASWEIKKDESEYCIVETPSGRIRGKRNRTLLEDQLFYSFRGIPFAKPPVGELRFKAPRSVDPWNNTLDAFEFGKHCLQYDDIKNIVVGYENCLYLNVFIPTKSTSIDTHAKLPVMFYIHGGGFVSGATNYFAPDFLMDENLIVVTANYRVGPFGFLSLNTSEYSGNMGFKDQALALKWVVENIGYFGGDKNQITICGHSSGAISANLHMISPHSNQLFQRTIMLSGSALYSGLIQKSGTKIQLYDLADELNYTISNENELIEFMKNIDGEILVEKTYWPTFVSGVTGRKESTHRWNLVIEDKNAIDPFLTKDPFDILTDTSYESKKDTLYSTGIMDVTLIGAQKSPKLLQILDEVFEFQLPIYKPTVDYKSDTYKEIAKRIRDFYFDGQSITVKNLDQGHFLVSDISFLYAIDLCARIEAKKSNTRTLFSKFTAYTDWNKSARQSKTTNYTVKYGDHSDQAYYLFWFSNDDEDVYQDVKVNPHLRLIVKNTANFYANFVKFRNVMPDNESVPFKTPNSDEFKYYDITNDGIFVRVDENRERIEFWNKLLNDFKGYWNITFDFQKLE